MSKKYVLQADLDYVDGHLRYGYRELVLTEKELKAFEELSEMEQSAWFQDGGETIVTDYEINGYGGLDLDTLTIEEDDFDE